MDKFIKAIRRREEGRGKRELNQIDNKISA